MRPVLFHVGTIPIWSHAVFVGLGTAVALLSAWYVARIRGRATQELLWIVSGGLIGAAILAKFGLGARYVLDATAPSLTGFLRDGGRTLLGGMAGAYLGVLITKRLIGYRAHTGDVLVPGVALGIAIGRVGCHLAEPPGTRTTLPWGVRLPDDAHAFFANCDACRNHEAMHPSFLYESVFMLLAAWWLYPRALRGRYPAAWMHDGDLFKLFVLAYALFRLAVEFVRGNPVMAWGLTGSQLMVLTVVPFVAAHFVRRARSVAPTSVTD
jgi:phosphatidylglycerol---prolipoprotein diacylglyceryl transferase